eukprot:TRINITY_DN8938_c0_g1_i2.p1 TRINITY_DN8938_c0_g1~~TRINITY_DN8938_c0_g1_i2.p1  ORF type:complete len:333 (-),score=49.91 TRINITY_DN8938_c0_g1_i2:23-1000(-)
MADIESGGSVSSYSNPFSDIPKYTKIIAAVLAVFYAFGVVFPQSCNYLALVPGYTFPPHFFLWNVITNTYFHFSLFDMISSVVVTLIFGKYLENVWGPKEYFKFIFIVNSIASVITFFIMIFCYYATHIDKYLFPPVNWSRGVNEGEDNLHGVASFSAAVIGFVVALKQLQPDTEISSLSVLGLRIKHLPALLLFIQIILWLGTGSITILYPLSGFIVSWVYLRWFQYRDGTKGDQSADFSFSSFFPEKLQPVVTAITNTLCFCTRSSPRTTIPGSSFQGSILQTDSKEAERRREKALQALDARLSEIKQPPKSSLSVDTQREVK